MGKPTARKFGGYVLEERIASGGTADVFLARPESGASPARELVIKRLLPSLRADAAARSTFAEEAALHRRFRHPNIVECYEAGEVDGEPFLAIELVAGADLHRVLDLSRTRKRPIAPALATYVAREVLAALEVVHGTAGSGIVHRDVSPSNIYLSHGGDVKLGDFGIAREASARSGRGGLATTIKGKFAYLAPEQVASEPVDHRADLFALANVLSEMMLGRPLFAGSGQLAVLLSIRDVRIEALDAPNAIPVPLVSVLKRALSRDPAQRFADAATFAKALEPFATVDRNTARRDLAQLVRWARQTSQELRAVGEHPDQRIVEPIIRPAPAIHIDSSILEEDEITPRPPEPVPAIVRRPPEPPPPMPAMPEPRPSGADAATAPFTPPPSYVRTVDGRLLGPFAYAKLIELVVTGRLDAEDHVDFLGTGFQPLAEIDELARHLAPRSSVTKQVNRPGAPDWHGFAAERYDEEVGGAIEPGIATAMAFTAGRRATGVLLAEHGDRRKEIYFVNGRVFHVASTEAAEMIGEYLVTRGLLERGDLDFALAVLPRFDGRLGEAITGLGLLEPVKMFKAIEEQGRDKIVEVFGWSDGEISFYSGAQPGKVEFPLDLPIGPIVEAGMASMLDEPHAVARYSAWVERRIRPREVPSSLRDAGWSPRVERALLAIKQPTRVGAVLDALKADGLSAYEAILAVESARVVGLLDWA